MMKVFIFVILISVSSAQQWPAQITSMNANGGGLSQHANTFPLNGLGQGPQFGGQMPFLGGPMGMGSMGSFPQGGPQRSPFPSMQLPQMPQMSQMMPNFGNRMPQMHMHNSFGGGGGQMMPFLPVQPQHPQPQQQRQQPSIFGGGGGGGGGFPLPSMNQQSGNGHMSPFQQHPRQFGQRQFQPSASFQQTSPPQQLTNSIQESSAGSLPKFLEGAPEEAITEFKRIIRQPNITYANKMKDVEKLVDTLDDPHQQLYHQFMDESDKTQQTKRDAIHKTVDGMSVDAQGQFAKISAILTNPTLPEEERWNRILTIYGKLEPSLRNEFEEKFKPLV